MTDYSESFTGNFASVVGHHGCNQGIEADLGLLITVNVFRSRSHDHSLPLPFSTKSITDYSEYFFDPDPIFPIPINPRLPLALLITVNLRVLAERYA